jgi:hypothetical protein
VNLNQQIVEQDSLIFIYIYIYIYINKSDSYINEQIVEQRLVNIYIWKNSFYFLKFQKFFNLNLKI